MSDATELKKLVKQLQSSTTEEVCILTLSPYDLYVAPSSISDFDYQDILGFLNTLKKDFQINEAILRVGHSRLFIRTFGAYPVSLSRKAKQV